MVDIQPARARSPPAQARDPWCTNEMCAWRTRRDTRHAPRHPAHVAATSSLNIGFASGKCCSDATWAASIFSGLHIPISLGLRPHPMRKYSSLKLPGAAWTLSAMLATLLSSLLSFALSMLLGTFGSMLLGRKLEQLLLLKAISRAPPSTSSSPPVRRSEMHYSRRNSSSCASSPPCSTRSSSSSTSRNVIGIIARRICAGPPTARIKLPPEATALGSQALANEP